MVSRDSLKTPWVSPSALTSSWLIDLWHLPAADRKYRCSSSISSARTLFLRFAKPSVASGWLITPPCALSPNWKHVTP